MAEQGGKYGTAWSRDELVLALYLYCQIPLGRCTQRSPEVIDLARIIGRTPASVARKLGNFGTFDPRLRSRGVQGLTHAGRNDAAVWEEFSADWTGLVAEAETVLSTRRAGMPMSSEVFRPPGMPVTERTAPATQRIGQDFFRRAVLASYESRCCLCGLGVPELLVASHIMPWHTAEKDRLNPRNGLALSSVFDRAFDCGLMTFDGDQRAVFAGAMIGSGDAYLRRAVLPYHGRRMRAPVRFPPRPEFLEWHRCHVFRG